MNLIPISEDQPSSSAPGSLLRALLSNKSVQQVDSSGVDSDADQLILDFGGKKYKLSCCASVRSHTSFAASHSNGSGSLIDSGCNGGLSGDDVVVLNQHPLHKADISGIANTSIEGAPICTVAGLIQSTKVPSLAYFISMHIMAWARLSTL